VKKIKKYTSRFFSAFSTKYNIQVLDVEHFENKASFRVSALQVFGAFVTVMTILIILTIYLVAFTGLREYIPGYADQSSKQKLYDLAIATDSLENKVTSNEKYIINLQNVFSNKLTKDEPVKKDTTKKYSAIKNTRSKEDSLLRQEVLEADRYNIQANKEASGMGNILFFTPARGKIVQKFQPEKKTYSITLTTQADEAVKSVLDGTVLLTVWTPEYSGIIVIQHNEQFISVYKHCNTMLKSEGDYVKAGEPVAFSARTNGAIKEPYLIFELWHRGYPIDPAKFILF